MGCPSSHGTRLTGLDSGGCAPPEANRTQHPLGCAVRIPEKRLPERAEPLFLCPLGRRCQAVSDFVRIEVFFSRLVAMSSTILATVASHAAHSRL